MELPRERAGPSHGGGVPLVSFGASPDDRMSIATLEGESDQSGDDGSVLLPPSGRSAVPDSDPEMVAMLARAAESVGLEWRPPSCPEPSGLDDWFLGVARAGSQGPTPVPFFPEVHDELTGTWTAPFTARNRSSGSSSLATLDGGAARGYTEVPPVERSVAMQLCPRTASTWRGNPLLPSWACRHSSALTGSAYAACGEAASALHAMALLQVHQAKALRDLHEGGHDPGVLSELRTATDLVLRATKVTARCLGRAMSTMVVQERHLWLCLADMKEVDKARFLNAPVSQTGLFGDAVENFAQQFSAALQQGPFEPLQTVEPKFLSMKTLLLLALASIKRVGDLHAFSVDDSCLQFGPADSQIILRPRPGYVPKVPTTPFRDQVVSLQALPPEEADPALALLCPVRALRHYVDRTQSFRTSDQLFVCHGGRQKGNAVSKQRMAHWIVDAITLAYQAQGVPCPFRLRAHSTRSVASSWALARGASLTDICRAAGWATPNTFARFYSLRVEPVSSCVLTSNG